MSGKHSEAKPSAGWSLCWVADAGRSGAEREPRVSRILFRAARCQRFPPQQLHLARQPGIGEPVDSAQRAAHLLVEAAGWRVDILGLDLEPPAAAGTSPGPGGLEER